MSIKSIEECVSAVLSKKFDNNVIIHSMGDMRRLCGRQRIKEVFLNKLKKSLNNIGLNGTTVSGHYVVTTLPIDTTRSDPSYRVLTTDDALPSRVFVVKDKELYINHFQDNTTTKLISNITWTHELITRLNTSLSKLCKIRRIGLYNNVIRLIDHDLTEIFLNFLALHDVEYHEQLKDSSKVTLKLVNR